MFKQIFGFLRSVSRLLYRLLPTRRVSIGDLVHPTRQLEDGSMILVLNTGAVIGPEAVAMLQALHSRSTGGVLEHLKVLAVVGPKKFMKKYYIGYGHKSIGDCGTITVFVEGISMLTAKALQDSQLYNGQESSTRFIDFADQTFINPAGTDEGDDVLETLRAFYLRVVAEMKVELTKRFPRQENEDLEIYEKAIAARAFDTARGFLPAGAMTNISWHSNLRQLADRILWLRHHPLQEAREIAEALEELLMKAFPSSFSGKRYPETEAYTEEAMRSYYWHDLNCPDFLMTKNNFDLGELARHQILLSSRPPKTELPKYLADCGEAQFRLRLDFGSFRDLQRQRSINQRMPLLTDSLGFHGWYLGELPKSLRVEAEAMLSKISGLTDRLNLDPTMRQYYIPMGYMVSCSLSGDLPALVYVVELRATRFVHPTLCARAKQMAESLEGALGSAGLVLHLDSDPNRFDIKRGTHDITVR